jgi:outer membrane protein
MKMQYTFVGMVAIALSLALIGAPTPAAAEDRFGFVDLQRALNETGEGAQAKRRLKSMFTKRQTELDKRQKRIKRMETDLQKQKGVLSEAAFAKRVESYRKSFVELQTTYVQFQRDLSERETKETGRILKRMQSILAEIGQRDRYTAIFEVNEGGVFYYRKSLDLTNQLIRLYDQRFPSKRGKRSSKGRSKKSGGGKAPSWHLVKVRPVL